MTTSFFGFNPRPPSVQQKLEEDAKKKMEQMLKPPAVEIPKEDIQPANAPPDEKTVKIAKRSLKQTNNSAAAIPSMQLSVTLTKNLVKGFFAFVPLFLYMLYTSKEKSLQNINLSIKAPTTPTIYRIAIGNDETELSVSFELAAGQPLRFLKETTRRASSSLPYPLFQPRSTLSSSLGPLRWRRQEPDTECNVVIEDPLLKESPVKHSVILSDRERMNIIRINPEQHPQQPPAERTVPVEASEWTTINAASIKVPPPLSPLEKHQTQKIPLPFHFDQQQGYYVSITQKGI